MRQSSLPFSLLWHFAKTRWLMRFKTRAALERWQQKKLRYYFKHVLPHAEKFSSTHVKTLADLPLMDKQVLLDEFAERNCFGISLDKASRLAMDAENTRDFSETLKGVTVGLSSGTSGTRGVFLVSDRERNQWAGILLAKTLPTFLLKNILKFWSRPVSIAFFLRANSNLYDTLSSRRIDFQFYDLVKPKDFVARLNSQLPDVLVAPATVLATLAADKKAGRLTISPKHIISVAEVLDDAVRDKIKAAFKVPMHQIYQATEGFLGYTCKHGNLHLNESHIVFEKNWIDEQRFEPIITDFTRSTQLITRYRLNDILVAAKEPCPCGNAEMHLERIEGRADEILWLEKNTVSQANAEIAIENNATNNQAWQPIYPDVLRQAFVVLGDVLAEYRVFQYGDIWQVAYRPINSGPAATARIRQAVKQLCDTYNAKIPLIEYVNWQPPKPGEKLKRWRCVEKPAGANIAADLTLNEGAPLTNKEPTCAS